MFNFNFNEDLLDKSRRTNLAIWGTLNQLFAPCEGEKEVAFIYIWPRSISRNSSFWMCEKHNAFLGLRRFQEGSTLSTHLDEIGSSQDMPYLVTFATLITDNWCESPGQIAHFYQENVPTLERWEVTVFSGTFMNPITDWPSKLV